MKRIIFAVLALLVSPMAANASWSIEQGFSANVGCQLDSGVNRQTYYNSLPGPHNGAEGGWQGRGEYATPSAARDAISWCLNQTGFSDSGNIPGIGHVWTYSWGGGDIYIFENDHEETPPPVECWDGSEAPDEESCPASVTCWDDSLAYDLESCPDEPGGPGETECDTGTKIAQLFCEAKLDDFSSLLMTLAASLVAIIVVFVGVRLVKRGLNRT